MIKGRVARGSAIMTVGARQAEAGADSRTGLEQVFLLHQAALLRFLRARGAGDAAEDLLQELWIKASSHVSGPVHDALPYLYRAANNLMLDRRRAEMRRARREQDWSEIIGLQGEAAREPSAERSLIDRDQLQIAQSALDALGERTALIFRRFRLEGESQRQIAEEENISVSAVEKHLQKAYRALLELRRRNDAD
jgi:RNA polymerase sigma-70 factor (ECF subfamily)